MLYTVYQITHRESGKVYIGKHQTLNPHDEYLGSGKMIRRAVKKYGLSAFQKEVLHVFESESEMNAKEAELVTEEFCARDDTYNLCPGGQGGWGYVNTSGLKIPAIQTEERKQRISKSLKDRWNSLDDYSKRAETNKRFKISSARFSSLGSLHSVETKKKISEKAKQRITNSQTGTCWITNGLEAKKIKLADLVKYPDWKRGRS